MQLLIGFESEPETYQHEEVVMVWLKRYVWTHIFNWHHSHIERARYRNQRIVKKYFMNGISQSDFMKIRICP